MPCCVKHIGGVCLCEHAAARGGKHFPCMPRPEHMQHCLSILQIATMYAQVVFTHLCPSIGRASREGGSQDRTRTEILLRLVCQWMNSAHMVCGVIIATIMIAFSHKDVAWTCICNPARGLPCKTVMCTCVVHLWVGVSLKKFPTWFCCNPLFSPVLGPVHMQILQVQMWCTCKHTLGMAGVEAMLCNWWCKSPQPREARSRHGELTLEAMACICPLASMCAHLNQPDVPALTVYKLFSSKGVVVFS